MWCKLGIKQNEFYVDIRNKSKNIFMSHYRPLPKEVTIKKSEYLTNNELQQLGVFWIGDNSNQTKGWSGGPAPVIVTRLHIRYNNQTFPEDLVFQETKDQQNFQGRYIIQHPWKGSPNQCSQAKEYFKNLQVREGQRAENYRMLTGANINEIKSKMNLKELPPEEGKVWWKKIWK